MVPNEKARGLKVEPWVDKQPTDEWPFEQELLEIQSQPSEICAGSTNQTRIKSCVAGYELDYNETDNHISEDIKVEED